MKFITFLGILLYFAVSDTELDKEISESIAFRMFEIEDTDEDEKLNTNQFISALTSVFNIEIMKHMINSFGREFVGRKRARNVILLSDIDQWIKSGELFKEYAEWKRISEEPEYPDLIKEREARITPEMRAYAEKRAREIMAEYGIEEEEDF